MASVYILKLQNGNVQVQKDSDFHALNPDAQVWREDAGVHVKRANCHIKDKSGSKIETFFLDEVVNVTRRDGTVTVISDLDTLYYELANFFFFKLGSGAANHLGVFDNYTDLVTQYPTAAIGDLAYVENSQGFPWLPGEFFGGTFYSKGPYLWNGAFWDSGVNEIAKQLEDNINDILSLQTALTNHVNDLANPHDTSDANLLVSDITTNDVSTSAHGFAPKLPNDAAKFLNGLGLWAVPAGGGGGTVLSGESAGITGQITKNTTYSITFTVTGAIIGDYVIVGFNEDFYNDLKLNNLEATIYGKVTAANTVELSYRINKTLIENTNRKLWAVIVK